MTPVLFRSLLTGLVSFFLLCAPATAFAWNATKYKGIHYVPLWKVKEFYDFKKMYRSGGKVILHSPGKGGAKLEFRSGGQEVLMNGVKFIFSHTVAHIRGKAHISVTDLNKILDPVMRPQHIKSASAFDTVILDPGHGGRDAGAVNRLGTEAGYNLKVARMLRDHLLRIGFKVVMTRDSDYFLSLKQRVELANRYKNAIFISIHFNAVGAGSSRARGIETFTLSPVGVAHYGRGLKASDFTIRQGNYQDSANIALATAIHWGSLIKLKNAGMSVPDRGIRRARYSVLTGVKHPAILFEGGFMSHPTESRLIHSRKYQRTLAESMAEAIKFYRKATLAKPKPGRRSTSGSAVARPTTTTSRSARR